MASSNHQQGTCLQEQLHLIQQKQQTRYKERITPKEVEHHHINLDLKTLTAEAKLTVNSEGIIVHDVDFLRAQIEMLELESSQLKTKLKQTESKLVRLSHQREEERRAMGGANSTVTQRIVDLSKKNRGLNSELASERNKVRELQAKLRKSEAEIAETQSHCIQKTTETETETIQTMLKQLKDQLQAANQKRVEYRSECQTLKQELKITHKVISKEVGEGVNVATLLKNGNGWRGRSQQIIALQNKTAELQQRLNDTDRISKRSSTQIKGNADHRQMSTLRKIEDTKKRSLELAQTELTSLNIEHSKLQHQFSALKSRNKILTAELKSLKSGSSQPSTPQLQIPSRPPSGSEIRQDHDKITILEQRNRRLQAQLTKCLNELQPIRDSAPVIVRQRKSAPLPPLAVSRGRTRAVANKMASVGQLCSNVEEDTLSRVNQSETEQLFELTLSLQQRLDLCNDKVVTAQTDLKQKHSNGKDKTKTTTCTADLEEQLEMTKNENEVLKETLEATRQEKLADIQLLQGLVRNTKCMFVESVRQFCTETTS